MKSGRFRAAVLAAAVATLALAGCSGLEQDQPKRARLEKTELRIGALPVVDDAPLYIALQRNYFADEGLDVKTSVLQGGGPAVQGLVGRQLDIAFCDYVTLFGAQARGPVKFDVLSEGYQAKPNVLGVVAAPGGKIQQPKDLAGKRIAVNTKGDLGEIIVGAALAANGVRADTVKYREIAWPKMTDALRRGEVDAAWMVEPYISHAAKTDGARLILDASTGPTAEFPIAGYVTTRDFARRYPNTAAAFERAITRAKKDAADRSVVEQVLPGYTKVDPETAVISAMGTFPTSDKPSPVRLPRVADLMLQFQILRARLDVKLLTDS